MSDGVTIGAHDPLDNGFWLINDRREDLNCRSITVMSKCGCGDPRHKKITVNRGDLKKLLDYCRADEAKHYEESDKPKGHIYKIIRSLNKSLEQNAV